jgi:glutamine amidotransferase
VGGDVDVTADPDAVDRADAVVIPGVGHFGQCVRALRASGMDRQIERFAVSERPMLGVCIGMQVLFRGSEEDPEPGLGLVDGIVRRLPTTVRVPHMGWNTVSFGLPHAFHAGLDGAYFYFVHSYAALAEETHPAGVTEYGTTFAATIASQRIYATQFHPEKSGDAGLQLYENFVKEVAVA